MAGHFHAVVGVDGDPDPSALLRDLNSYGSQALSRWWSRPAGGTWWTESGSKRKLSTPRAVHAAIHYVRTQPKPLALWINPEFPGERGA